MRPLDSHFRRAGFTLLEILAVVSILSVLLGVVLSAIHSAQRQSKRAIARAEVRAVESALKAYLDHYGNWDLFWPFLPIGVGDKKDRWFVIDPVFGSALQGMIEDDPTGSAKIMNPDALPFIEFSRHLRTDDGRVPVNPWNGEKKPLAEYTAMPESPERGDARFFIAIDYNFDGMIDLRELGLTDSAYRFPKARSLSPSDPSDEIIERVSRPVVVWTYNPDNTRDEAIVSWME